MLSSQQYARAHAYGIVAMSHWRMNQVEEAQRMLAEGEDLAKNVLPKEGVEKIGSSWVAWLVARIGLDEAVSLIQDVAKPPNKADVTILQRP